MALSLLSRLSYGVGHAFNDLCAAMWFSYLIIYMDRVVGLTPVNAGLLLLLGQVSDAVATPVIGIESDKQKFTRIGRRKVWYLGGFLAVLLSFPFIFNTCIRCDHPQEWVALLYYSPFIALFQFGWAAVQIAHLSLIPELTNESSIKTELNLLRYTFTIISNILVYALCWVLFRLQSDQSQFGPADASKFMLLAFSIVGLGLFFSAIFFFGVKEDPVDEELMSGLDDGSVRLASGWKNWFKLPQFYQVCGLYMMCRLIVNVTQVYVSFYVVDTAQLNKEMIAIAPLVMYIGGLISAVCMKPLHKAFGHKITLLFGLLIIGASSAWFYFQYTPGGSNKYHTLGSCALLGVSGSILLISSLGITTDMIGQNTGTAAFVMGAMSFADKMLNGIAVMVVQKLQPVCERSPAECIPVLGPFYRQVMTYLPAGAACLALLILLTVGRRSVQA